MIDPAFSAALQGFFAQHAGLRCVEGLPTGYSIPKESMAAFEASTDTLYILPRAEFESEVAYYGVLFHELMHATGHPSRLNRTLLRKKSIGAAVSMEDYAFEEMVAEFGAAMLLSLSGLQADAYVAQTSLYYVAGFMGRLPKEAMDSAVVHAFSVASAVVLYILGDTFLSSQTS